MSALPWPLNVYAAPDNLTGSDIDAALKARPWWQVALPGSLEQRYRVDTMGTRITLLQRSGWLALLIFDSFLLVDWLMARDVFVYSIFVRLGIFTPVSCAVLLAVKRWQHSLVQRRWTEFGDGVVMLSGWAAGACLALILLRTRSPLAAYYHVGYMVVIIYGILVQPLGFRSAVAYGLGMLLLHVWSANKGQAMPEHLQLAILHLLVCTVALALAAIHTVERARRRRYLLLLQDQGLIDQLGAVNEQLQRLSRSDVLTGVANRRHFHDHLQQVWQRASHESSSISILMLDVDHFKAYNDSHGHPAGDACLRQVAKAMADHLRRPMDFIARYGGEEFVAVLPGANADVARQVAERVRQGIEALHIEHQRSSTRPFVTVSIGVASVVPGSAGLWSGQSADKLVSCADRALYGAKRGDANGSRNRVCVHDGTHQESMGTQND